MNQILFFPWLRIAEPVFLDGFSLFPYSKGEGWKGCDQEIISNLENFLNLFYDNAIKNVHDVTILSINDQILHEIDEDLEVELSLLVELIAFCGLSDRRFFLNGGSYCNRDNFHLKKFESNSVVYKVTTRRRDGLSENIMSEKFFRETKPDHVSYSRINLNQEFLRSLVSARCHSRNWDSIFQGIINFNLSNSDSSSVFEAMELVFLVSAFEQLLECKNGNENDLVCKIIGFFNTSSSAMTNRLDCVKLKDIRERKNFQKCDSIQEAWIKDFFRLRGDMAHGKKNKSYPCQWTLKEHLLLGSFIFPLVLKDCLSKEKIYTKSPYDHFLVNFFLRILCQENISSKWSEIWIECLGGRC
jgi:hypothetical protein